MLDLTTLKEELNAHQGELLGLAAILGLATEALHDDDADGDAVVALSDSTERLRGLSERVERWIALVNAEELRQRGA